MSIVRVKTKGQITLPNSIREQVGLNVGDILEAKEEQGKIILTPQSVVDRRLAESFADFKAGRSYGPFNSAADMIKDMKHRVKKMRNKR